MHILLGSVIGLVVLVTVIVTLRMRRLRPIHQQPEFGEIDEYNEGQEATGEMMSEPRVRTERGWGARAVVQKKETRASLGFDELEDVLDQPITQKRSMLKPRPNINNARQSAPIPTKPSQAKQSVVAETVEPAKKIPSILVFYIAAKPDQNFVGYELLQALLSAGLRFGEMSIFHRHENASGQGKVLFSLASAGEPGTFDMNAIGAYSGRGLCLFMRLKGPEHNLATFDLMIATARQLADDLDALILDEKRQELSVENINQYRAIVRQHQNKMVEQHGIYS